MAENLEKVKLQALDLRENRAFPRSPRALLGGYVIVGRTLDKVRAALTDQVGEYHIDCPVDNIWLGFTEIKFEDFKNFVATGASDVEVGEWVAKHAKQRSREEIIQWNNKQRDARLSEMPVKLQVYMEDYIPQFVPNNRPVYTFFDVYDLEEQRI